MAHDNAVSSPSPASSAIALVALGLLSTTGTAHAQDLEPRAYSASPTRTNFLVAGYMYSTGSVSPVPSLPVTGVQATINTATFGYERTFGLFGRSASLGIALPYVAADLSGNVEAQSRSISRSGLGDLSLRLATNLVGGPALTPAEFARREPTTALGTSLLVVAPTGDYNSAHLINISAHRWALRPEIGLSQPIGNWFSDVAAGVWLYSDNTNFFNGRVRSQDPLWEFQFHAGYNFRPGLWLAADATYYTGGDTSVNGVSSHAFQANSRYGLTLSIPIAEGVAVKLAWSSWLTSRTGANYDTFGATLQYRWFDP